MPSLTKVEREQKRLLQKKKLEAKRLAKERRFLEEEKNAASSSINTHTTRRKREGQLKQDDGISSSSSSSSSSSPSSLLSLLNLPEDSLRHVLCYAPARELGCMILSCRTINYMLSESRVPHLLSRLHKPNMAIRNGVGFTDLCKNEAEARQLLTASLSDGDKTGRLITQKSQKEDQGGGDADEYVAYARFIEEGVCGYAPMSIGGKQPTLLPPIVNGRYASASPEHSLCRVGGDGTRSGAGGSGVASWGVGKRGQLGHGKRDDESKPRMLLGGIGYGIRIVQVSAGGGLVRVAHSLLLTSTGRVLSFGTAQYGQLGHGYSSGKQLSDVLRPQYIEALANVRCTCVSAGELHSAVVTTDGDVYTWGDGFCGQLGLGDKRPQLLPKHVTLGGLEDECVASVSCGNRHTLCVTEDGEVFSFGLGHFGVLGRSYTPFEYDADASVVDLAQGAVPPPMAMAPGLHESALVPPSANGGGADIVAADENRIAEETLAHLDLLANLTLDDSSDQCIPKIIDSLQGVFIVGASAGHRHSMVLDNKGGLYTFGSGAAGALGHGDYIKQQYPMKVMEFANSDIRIMQMSAGVDISMAVTTTGDVYAWGNSQGGRLGLPISGDVSIPRRVSVPSLGVTSCPKVVDVECGYVHSIIVGLDGKIYVCGGVGINGDDDGQKEEELEGANDGKPLHVPNFNVWHRIAEPTAKASRERWKKYGKYEVKGRKKMMEQAEKWST